jgi:hypothetical protein
MVDFLDTLIGFFRTGVNSEQATLPLTRSTDKGNKNKSSQLCKETP